MYSPAIIALRDRVKRGNDLLFRAWVQILEIEDLEEQSLNDDRWYRARDKLYYLCLELEAKGYEDCLYIDEQGKKTKNCLQNPDPTFFCRVCPCASGKALWYSEQELFANLRSK